MTLKRWLLLFFANFIFHHYHSSHLISFSYVENLPNIVFGKKKKRVNSNSGEINLQEFSNMDGSPELVTVFFKTK